MSGECEDGVFLALKMQEDSYLPIEAQCVECEDGFSWLRYLPSLVFLLTKLGLPIYQAPNFGLPIYQVWFSRCKKIVTGRKLSALTTDKPVLVECEDGVFLAPNA